MGVSNEHFMDVLIKRDLGEHHQLLKSLLEESSTGVDAETAMNRVEGVAGVLQQTIPEFNEVAHAQPHIQMMWLATQLNFSIINLQNAVNAQLVSGHDAPAEEEPLKK